MTRAIYGLYIVLVAAFVLSSIAQVARPLFGIPQAEAARPAAAQVGAPCAAKLSEQIRAIERARSVASEAPSDDEARAAYVRERGADRDRAELEQACAGDPNGTEALAALARLDRAAEARASKDAAELTTVRLGAHSFISGHPR